MLVSICCLKSRANTASENSGNGSRMSSQTHICARGVAFQAAPSRYVHDSPKVDMTGLGYGHIQDTLETEGLTRVWEFDGFYLHFLFFCC